jgi:hypothetical protein
MFILNTRLVWLIFTFEFIRRPVSPILSPSSRTFVELTLVNEFSYWYLYCFEPNIGKYSTPRKCGTPPTMWAKDSQLMCSKVPDLLMREGKDDSMWTQFSQSIDQPSKEKPYTTHIHGNCWTNFMMLSTTQRHNQPIHEWLFLACISRTSKKIM